MWDVGLCEDSHNDFWPQNRFLLLIFCGLLWINISQIWNLKLYRFKLSDYKKFESFVHVIVMACGCPEIWSCMLSCYTQHGGRIEKEAESRLQHVKSPVFCWLLSSLWPENTELDLRFIKWINPMGYAFSYYVRTSLSRNWYIDSLHIFTFLNLILSGLFLPRMGLILLVKIYASCMYLFTRANVADVKFRNPHCGKMSFHGGK